ncbi:MAG: NAD(P)H-dependent oxidoreductase [Methanomicrobiales archaeon]|nr:NAD(P)H-dependent oxidoreductase [Methanomicrobiales archaeon]
MSVLVILAHPSPGSFNHAIALTARVTLQDAGHHVIFHDLYAEHFPPVLPSGEIPAEGYVPPLILQHCRELLSAEGIVIVHPNWWGQPPAILKGWVDRVLRPRIAYRFREEDAGEGIPTGLLKAKTALVFNTSNTPPEREKAVFGDPLERIWKDCIFGLCGIGEVRRRMFSVVVTSSPEERERWLGEVKDTIREAFPHREHCCP